MNYECEWKHTAEWLRKYNGYGSAEYDMKILPKNLKYLAGRLEKCLDCHGYDGNCPDYSNRNVKMKGGDEDDRTSN